MLTEFKLDKNYESVECKMRHWHMFKVIMSNRLEIEIWQYTNSW